MLIEEKKYIDSLSETDVERYKMRREKAKKIVDLLVMGLTYREAVMIDDIEYAAMFHAWNEYHRA